MYVLICFNPVANFIVIFFYGVPKTFVFNYLLTHPIHSSFIRNCHVFCFRLKITKFITFTQSLAFCQCFVEVHQQVKLINILIILYTSPNSLPVMWTPHLGFFKLTSSLFSQCLLWLNPSKWWPFLSFSCCGKIWSFYECMT